MNKKNTFNKWKISRWTFSCASADTQVTLASLSSVWLPHKAFALKALTDFLPVSCIMDKEVVCSLEGILCIDYKPILQAISCAQATVVQENSVYIEVCLQLISTVIVFCIVILQAYVGPSWFLVQNSCWPLFFSFVSIFTVCLVQVRLTPPPLPRPPLRRLSTVRQVRIYQPCKQWRPCQKTPWRTWGESSHHLQEPWITQLPSTLFFISFFNFLLLVLMLTRLVLRVLIFFSMSFPSCHPFKTKVSFSNVRKSDVWLKKFNGLLKIRLYWLKKKIWITI